MFCPNCGNQIPDGSVFCPSCGARMDAAGQTQPEANPQPEAQPEPQYEAPKYEQPAYEAPKYEQPAQPAYQQPAYQQPAQPAYQQPAQPAADSGINSTLWLVLSILATLFCCVPTGVVAIVFAAKINTCLNQGDVAGAQEACKKAKLWTIVSAVLALVVVIIYFIIVAVSGVSIMDEMAYMY